MGYSLKATTVSSRLGHGYCQCDYATKRNAIDIQAKFQIYSKKKRNKKHFEKGGVLLENHAQEQKDEIKHSTKLEYILC